MRGQPVGEELDDQERLRWGLRRGGEVGRVPVEVHGPRVPAEARGFAGVRAGAGAGMGVTREKNIGR
jgi:hypothetical protein